MRRRLYVPVFSGLLFICAGMLVWAQEEDVSSIPPPEQQSQAQQAPKQTWSQEELNDLVAPIALYPDPLLGQMLVASTYPLEVVEANQWLQRNTNLSGRARIDAAKQQPWDPSIQALVAVPDALAELNKDIGWTTELGNAFLAQQAEVMGAVQHMRAQAQANGALHSTLQQTVRMENQGGQEAIAIEPANPQVIYVPYYDPMYVWGPPVYGYYPPLYYPRWGFGFGIGFNLAFCFDDWGGWGFWGWEPNWFGRAVFVNNYFFPRYGFHYDFRGRFAGGRTIWAHNPEHRLGIPYGNRQVSNRFERASIASRNSFRPEPSRNFSATQNRNSYAGRLSGRAPEQGRSGANPQRYQGYQNQRPQAQRYQAPQQYRHTTSQQQNSFQQQYRAAPRQSQRQIQASAPRYSRSFSGGSRSFSGNRGSSGGVNLSRGSGRSGSSSGDRRHR